MTTLGTMKAEIADDLGRSNLTSQIASAISSAIDHYKSRRFWFNSVRSATFATVAAQSTYSSSDDSDIPLMAKVDRITLADSGGIIYVLDRISPDEMEELLDSSASSGRPECWTWIEDTFRFHPVPDAVYTVRLTGVYEKAAPADDTEANNVWMTKAYELIRCRAKVYLYGHVVHAPDKAGLAGQAEAAALAALDERTSLRMADGQIMPTVF